MKKAIFELILQLIIVIPLIILFLKRWESENWNIVFMFSAFFIVNSLVLYLPSEYISFRLFNGSGWNWSGKIYSSFVSIIFLIAYRKFELKDYFLTFRQNKVFAKNNLIIIVAIILLQIVITTIMSSTFETKTKWDLNTILFQLTAPSISEEIAYRGIMLGLLVKVLKPNIIIFKKNFGNPSILITAILFGLVHGLHLTNSFGVEFNMFSFFFTMSYGIFWGWLTIRSGSILLALISHSLANVTYFIAKMR